jgi:hypothetical protein
MAGDEEAEEREFLADLQTRTGRDLAQWMAAIAAQNFSDKNEVIDWLRAQGIPFARASWLERIHSNGGRPIYLQPPGQPGDEGKLRPPAAKATPRLPSRRELADLDRLLAASKGYRPLYLMLEAEIRGAVSDLAVRPKAGYLSLGAPREFAAVTFYATELRLGLDLGDAPHAPGLEKPRMRGPGPAISHMVVLTDARQVNADLLILIKAANRRVNG